MHHKSWIGGSPSLGQTLTIPKTDDDVLKQVSRDTGLAVKDIISLAVSSKVQEWTGAGDVEKAMKQDLMLAKLMRR
jgi:hypothetical protein